MDASAKVYQISNLVPQNAFFFVQSGRNCLFFKHLSAEEILRDLKERDDINIIVITECHIDTPQISAKAFDALEMMIITNCHIDILPSLGTAHSLSYLDLSFNSISTISNDLSYLRMLRVLKLSGNRISSIPAEILYLDVLQVLDLSRNLISHLPKEIFTLRSLIYFDCSFNTVFRLPNNISNLQYLEVLFLSDNMLTSLPTSFGMLKCLQRLNLSSNRFEYIPFCIFECSALKELIFPYNQASGVIPDNICRLVNLEILSLAYNKFTKLPGKLSNLTKLQYFNIKGNNVGRIPEELICRCRNLALINCGSCGLKEFPSCLSTCHNLRVLDLSGNQLGQLPSEDSVPKNLISLSLTNNKLSFLPQWICDLKHLVSLSVRRNLLEDLPDGFAQVTERLRMVDISHNHFEQLPSCLFSANCKITYFHIDNNPVLRIPAEICNLKYLTHLSLSSCPYIYELPREIGSLIKLRSLRLCSNSLLKLPPTMHRLENLNYLDLSNNKFSRFPIVICYIPHLKVLLYNNCCHTCTYLEPDPPGWFDRTSLIDPEASMDKLGAHYIEEVETLTLENEKPHSLEEELALDEEVNKVPQLGPEEIEKLTFRRTPHRIPILIQRMKSLVHLSLQNNGLHFLPNIFDKLQHLRRVHFNDNNLRKIPTSLALCKTLTDIDLRNNKLKEINTELHRLPHLKRLELGGNDFPACLSEVIKHSNLRGLRGYLEAWDENMQNTLHQMCEKFVRMVTQEDWIQILRRLGISEDSIDQIEDEFPGGYNFRRRVARALEYWSGLDLNVGISNLEFRTPETLNTEVITTTSVAPVVKAKAPLTNTPNSDELEVYVENPSQVTYPEPSTVAMDTEGEMSVFQPISLRFLPVVAGPRATPERLIHILSILGKTELAEAMTAILAKAHIRQL